MPSSESMSAAEIADDIESQIHKGKLKAREKLPSYRQLSLSYGVGITTVSSAMALLRDRGVVVGRPGVGVYVAED